MAWVTLCGNLKKIIFLYFLPFQNNQGTMLEMAYPSRRSRLGQSARSSTRIPLRRLEKPKSPSVDALDEDRGESTKAGHGMSRTNSSYNNSGVPATLRHFNSVNDSSSADNFRNVNLEAEEEQQQPSSPSPAWAAEPTDNVSRKPLLRSQWKPIKM